MWLLAAIGHIATTGADSGFWGEGWLLFVHVLVQAVMSRKRPDFVQLFQLLITLLALQTLMAFSGAISFFIRLSESLS